jgi:hypothetical protein
MSIGYAREGSWDPSSIIPLDLGFLWQDPTRIQLSNPRSNVFPYTSRSTFLSYMITAKKWHIYNYVNTFIILLLLSFYYAFAHSTCAFSQDLKPGSKYKCGAVATWRPFSQKLWDGDDVTVLRDGLENSQPDRKYRLSYLWEFQTRGWEKVRKSLRVGKSEYN